VLSAALFPPNTPRSDQVVGQCHEESVGSFVKFEHIGLTVCAPIAMAQWYARVLGGEMLETRGTDDAPPCAAFLRLPGDGTVLELGGIPGAHPLSGRLVNPLELHLAFETDDPEADAERLVQSGATRIEECPLHMPGEQLLLLRDPWGNTVQLVKRATPIGGRQG
jgi:hypothetical protein